MYEITVKVGIHIALQQTQTSLTTVKAHCSYCGILLHVICILRTEEFDLEA
jgi:hypothetical protein